MVSGMRSVVVDKLASVTQACRLSHEVRISADIPAEGNPLDDDGGSDQGDA